MKPYELIDFSVCLPEGADISVEPPITLPKVREAYKSGISISEVSVLGEHSSYALLPLLKGQQNFLTITFLTICPTTNSRHGPIQISLTNINHL